MSESVHTCICRTRPCSKACWHNRRSSVKAATSNASSVRRADIGLRYTSHDIASTSEAPLGHIMRVGLLQGLAARASGEPSKLLVRRIASRVEWRSGRQDPAVQRLVRTAAANRAAPHKITLGAPPNSAPDVTCVPQQLLAQDTPPLSLAAGQQELRRTILQEEYLGL
mmetsp:Transcript_8576/g.19662  ORF Transcript_8576/g.19662 Transcript_8576/m.19662 type:complete len:168 (+) Transcript_8576:36-539(+)